MPTDTDESLGFLVSDITRLLREQFNQTAEQFGLTLAQGRALVRLSRNQGISQVALARLLEIQPITLFRQLDRMAEAGLVDKRANPEDRRAQKLYLTEAGTTLLGQIEAVSEDLTTRAMAGIPDTEQAALFRTLGLIKHNLVSRQSSDDSTTN